jgi:hypothetical protein
LHEAGGSVRRQELSPENDLRRVVSGTSTSGSRAVRTLARGSQTSRALKPTRSRSVITAR